MYRSGPASPREAFLDQFEIDGSEWLYRHRMTGPAYRVTDVEKDTFVAAYQRHKRRVAWVLAVIVVAVYVVLFIPPLFDMRLPIFSKKPSTDGFWAVLLLNLVLQWIDDYFATGIPLKTLHLRTPLAPAWSREDRQRLALQRLPLTGVVGTATISFAILLYFALERPAVGPMSLAVIIASGVALAWAIVQGTRKWLHDRRDYAAANLI